MMKKSSKSKSELEKQISRTIRFLENAGPLTIAERHCVFLEGVCGNCEILARQKSIIKGISAAHSTQRRFQKVLAKLGGRWLEAYQCPECGHLADAQQTECLMKIGQTQAR